MQYIDIYQLVCCVVIKLVTSVSLRCFFFFIPFLAASFEVPVESFPTILAIGEMSGLVSLLAGPLANLYGNFFLCMLGQGFLVLSNLLPMLTTGQVWVLIISRVLNTVGFSLFTPGLQALLTERSPPDTVTRNTGLNESAWALSSLLGLPAFGALLYALPWRYAFGALFILSILGIISFYFLLRVPPSPPDAPSDSIILPASAPPSPPLALASTKTPFVTFKYMVCDIWTGILTSPLALVLLLCTISIFVVDATFASVFGIFLKSNYSLSADGVSLSLFVIGSAEITASVSVSLIGTKVDRSLLSATSFFFCTISCALLAFISPLGLPVTLTLVFFKACFTEVSLVLVIACASENIPGEHNNNMMCTMWACMSVGSMLGGLFGQSIWDVDGIRGVGSVCMLGSSLGMMLMVLAAERVLVAKGNKELDIESSKERISQEIVVNAETQE